MSTADFDYHSELSSISANDRNLSSSSLNGGISAAIHINAKTVAEWQTDCIICGISSFDIDHVAILGYFPLMPGIAEVDNSADWDNRDYIPPIPPQWPELQILHRVSGELICSDTIEIRNSSVENTSPNDFYMLSNYQNLSRALDFKRWSMKSAPKTRGGSRGLSPTLFIISGLDIVVGRVRDTVDRIEIALATKDIKLAVDLANEDKNSLRLNQMEELIALYIDILFQQDKVEEAALECRRLFEKDRALWEKWVLIFAKRNRVSVIAPLIPTGAPRLTPSLYQVTTISV